MAALSAEQHVQLLKRAELQFRLMVAVRTATTLGSQPLTVPVLFTFGRKTVSGQDLVLSQDEADEAAYVLEHTATYSLAAQIQQAMKDVFGNPEQHSDPTIRAAFAIAGLLRHAYAHQPFHPHWLVDRPWSKDKVFDVPGVARLDTSGLEGKPIRWQDYGGLLAVFRLSRYVRSAIWPSEPVNLAPEVDGERVKVPPTKPGDIVQLGRILTITLDRLPESAVPIGKGGEPVEFHTPDGVYTLQGAKVYGHRQADETRVDGRPPDGSGAGSSPEA